MSITTDIKSAIERHHSFLILGHVDPDIDAIGSCLAMQRQLISQGKSAKIVVDGQLGEGFEFLPDRKSILCNTLETFEPDVIMCLDSCTQERVAALNLAPTGRLIINIDHHPDNTRFGDINYVSDYGSVGETLTHLFREYGWEIDASMATCLYAAICYDTGRFNHSNVTQKTMETAAYLIGCGMSAYYVTSAMYEQLPKEAFELMKMALDHLIMKDRYVYSVIPHGAPECDFKVIDFIRQMEGPDIIMLFTEVSPNVIKVNLRSKGDFDVMEFAALFGGGGHRKASGIKLEKSLEDSIALLCRALDERLG